jgi:hypothetical protein
MTTPPLPSWRIPAGAALAGTDAGQELLQIKTLHDVPDHAGRVIRRQQFFQATGPQEDLPAVGLAQARRGRRQLPRRGGLREGLAVSE